MRGRDPERSPVAEGTPHRMAVDLFSRLAPSCAHREWTAEMTQDFTDPAACDLCAEGLCWQRAVRVDGAADLVVVHGLPTH